MATTRPYLVTFKGVTSIVEAPGAAQAVQYVASTDITDLRPARPNEVTAWMRSGKEIPIFDPKAASTPAAVAQARQDELARRFEGAAERSEEAQVFGDIAKDLAREGWDHQDARAWIGDQSSGNAAALKLWDKIVEKGSMSLAAFDDMVDQCPAFAIAISAPTLGPDQPFAMDEVIAKLKEAPAPLEDVVDQIGRRKRHELFVLDHLPEDAAAANERAVVEGE